MCITRLYYRKLFICWRQNVFRTLIIWVSCQAFLLKHLLLKSFKHRKLLIKPNLFTLPCRKQCSFKCKNSKHFFLCKSLWKKICCQPYLGKKCAMSFRGQFHKTVLRPAPIFCALCWSCANKKLLKSWAQIVWRRA